MTDEQNRTDQNKELIVDSLDALHQQAVFLRYGGYNYQRIAKELLVSYSIVRQWFMTGGLCQSAFDELQRIRMRSNRKLVKVIDKMIENAAVDAVTTLHNATLAGNWMAAQSLLDRAGFSPVQRIHQEIEQKSDKEAVETIKEAREYVRLITAKLDTHLPEASDQKATQ